MIIYSNQIVREAPEGAIILATSHDTPCIYIKDNVLLIHGHPYLNYKYIEEILGPELLDEIDGSEQ